MSEPFVSLYPALEPYANSWLKVSSLHQIYYEMCGNPNGVPVIFLHGGPGSGCNPMQRRFFDPAHYRIILMDQRGCGRSLPLGEVQQNTTDDLIRDIEALRTYLGIDQWHVFGGSWGSTLALAYATRHPAQVMSLTLRGIFLSQRKELDWFLGEVKLFFPEAWQRLCDYLPASEQSDVIGAYEKLVFSKDSAISVPAAIRWNAFESSMMSLLPRESNPAEDEVELARARVQIHYIKHQCFVGHRNLLQEANATLSHIPTAIVQGRYDMVCPPITAWQLARVMPHARFTMVADAGHSATESGITSALVEATERFKHL